MKRLYVLMVPALLALSSAVVSAQKPDAPDLQSELNELVEVVVGRYSGEVVDPADHSGERRTTLHHKIVRVDLPSFGEYVIYHQVSRDALDSVAPWQQKLYVFDQDPKRRYNSMRAFVIPTELGLANFEGCKDFQTDARSNGNAKHHPSSWLVSNGGSAVTRVRLSASVFQPP
jgi:hypothetical protein